MTEKQFQAEVVDAAKRLGWSVYHTNDSRRCEPGFPDLVLVRDRVLYRELKTEIGRLSASQKVWGEKLVGAGADYAVWRPSEMRDIIVTLSKS